MKNVLLIGCYEGVTGLSSVTRINSKFTSKALADDLNAAAVAVTELGFKAYALSINADESLFSYKHFVNFLSDKIELIKASELETAIKECVAVMVIGVPAMAGTEKAFLDATLKPYILNYYINGERKGEIGIYSTYFASKNIPVIMASGCESACGECRREIDGIYTVTTKKAQLRDSAECYLDEKVRKSITETAKSALLSLELFKTDGFKFPLDIKVEFIREDYLEDRLYNKNCGQNVKRIDSRTLEKRVYEPLLLTDFLF